MRHKIAFYLTTAVLLVASIGILSAPEARGASATVVYNLYATDGYIEMADSEPVYTYGFIGGRQGAAFTFQKSFCRGNGSRRACGKPENVTVPGGAVAPVGGPWQGQDSQFAGHAQFPAPVIYATVGDVVEIRLKNLGVAANPNAPNDPHSIHLHGLDVDAANDGVPETSVAAVPANLCEDGSTAPPDGSCGKPAPGAGNVVVYMFTARDPGSSMYHCHQEADIHVNMGMYGALVVYNQGDAAAATGPGQGRGGKLFGAQYDRDYVLLLSDFDVRGHADEEGTYGGLVPANTWDPDPYNWALYQPQYWFINGLSFPQTIHASSPSGYSFEEWLEAHPGYDPLITGSSSKFNRTWFTKGEKVLIRMINMGFETQPMHMHGYHGKVIGSDQRAWDWALSRLRFFDWPRPFGEGLEKNTLTIGSGETYEWLIDLGKQSYQSTYPAATETKYDSASNLPVPNTGGGSVIPLDGETGGEHTYIGGPKVTGIVGPADPAGFGTQYFPFHNHDDYKATNNGSYPGGMFTMIVPQK